MESRMDAADVRVLLTLVGLGIATVVSDALVATSIACAIYLP